jgi:AcrR family transcriptional regulator
MQASPLATASPPHGAESLTARGARTRTALVDAARRVFERDGFLTARVTDIADAAGVAHGSFYTYFPDKKAILAAVLAELQEEMLHPQLSRAALEDDPAGTIHDANRAYLESYRRNAGLMALLEDMAAIDEDFLQLRRERTEAFVARNARAIRRLQKQRLADAELDPEIAALAISSMVSRTAYAAFVWGRNRGATDFDAVLRTVTRLWLNALRIPGTTNRRD